MFFPVREILPLTNMVESGGVLADLCLRNQNYRRARGPVELKGPEAKRVFLVTDSFFSERGTALEIARSAGECQEIFDQVTPDPTAELIARGTARLKAFQPDLVVALGGGSPMDAAKAMVYFSGEPIPLAAIPTTSGSGAEVTDFAIVTHNEVKHPLVSERLRPQIAILDSELLRSCPGASLPTQALTSWPMPWRPWRGGTPVPLRMPWPGTPSAQPIPCCRLPTVGSPRCGCPFTWLPPWRPWPFPRRDWGFATP